MDAERIARMVEADVFAAIRAEERRWARSDPGRRCPPAILFVIARSIEAAIRGGFVSPSEPGEWEPPLE